MGFIACVCFLAFCALYMVFSDLQWPLLVGTGFFFYLERKYSQKEESDLFYLPEVDEEIQLPAMIIARPSRLGSRLVFPLKASVCVYDTESLEMKEYKLQFSLTPREVLLFDMGMLVWCETELLCLGWDGAKRWSFHLGKTGLTLMVNLDDRLIVATTDHELLIFSASGELSRHLLKSVAIHHLDQNRFCLQNGQMITVSDQIHYGPMEDSEILGMSRVGEDYYSWLPDGKLRVLKEEKFTEYDIWNRETFSPRLFLGDLFYVNQNRKLCVITSQGSNQPQELADLSEDLILWRFLPSSVWMVLESRGFTRIIQVSCDDEGVYRVHEFKEAGLLKPLGIQDGEFWFGLDGYYYNWKVNEAEPVQSGLLQDLRAVYFFGDVRIEHRSNGVFCQPEGKSIGSNPSLLAWELQSIGLLPLSRNQSQ
ncbi:MAG: hypothetical protein H3C47_15605 [Candidatus Cloacimonetes bacterium]|nr:hypothetical protein [Candidatus Cloacimonadota bacterium]